MGGYASVGARYSTTDANDGISSDQPNIAVPPHLPRRVSRWKRNRISESNKNKGVECEGAEDEKDGDAEGDDECVAENVDNTSEKDGAHQKPSSAPFDPDRAEHLQKLALAFVSDIVFFAIPVRSNKSFKKQLPVYWVEPLPNLIEDSLAGRGILDKDTVQLAPTGALVDGRGGVKIFFANASLEYVLTDDHIEMLDPRHTSRFVVAPPRPPKLKARAARSLSLSWYAALPLPAGFVHTVEVQYSQETKTPGLRWQALVSKSYHKSGFYECTFEPLAPGSAYRFRMRYLCVRGWSDYSESSEVFCTLPAEPDAPAPPVCTAITCYAVELTWQPPPLCNGAEVCEYVLRGKGVGDAYCEVYRGPRESYLALGLFPQYAYSFQLAAVNAVGSSPFSAAVTVQTPPSPARRHAQRRLQTAAAAATATSTATAATETLSAAAAYFSEAQIEAASACRDAWTEHWDPRTERPFYFNSILASRQLDLPDALRGHTPASSPSSPVSAASPRHVPGPSSPTSGSAGKVPQRKLRWQAAVSSTPSQPQPPVGEAEAGKAFRVKRYRLLRGLARRKTALLRTVDASGGGGEAGPPSSLWSGSSTRPGIGGDASRRDTLCIALRREAALEDFCRAVASLSSRDLQCRFRFSFEGEDGIDSGGIAKDAFLLLSRAAAQAAGPRGLRYMAYARSGAPATPTGADNDGGLYFLPPPSPAPSPSFSSSAVGEVGRSGDSGGGPLWTSPEAFAVFLGRFLGKAVLDRQLVDFPASDLLLQMMAGVYEDVCAASAKERHMQLLPALLEDLRALDADFHQSMAWILAHDVTDALQDETFSVQQDGVCVPLCANGDRLAVTEANKCEYVCLLALWKLRYSVSGLLTPFLEAFRALVPLALLDEADLSARELGLLLAGKPTVCVEELRAYCVYQDDQFSEFHDSAVYFWRAVREFDDGTRRRLLHFFTGSARVPLDGYDPPLTLTLGTDMLEDSLPKAHTCFNQLVLPLFSKYEVCKAKLIFAIDNCATFELS